MDKTSLSLKMTKYEEIGVPELVVGIWLFSSCSMLDRNDGISPAIFFKVPK